MVRRGLVMKVMRRVAASQRGADFAIHDPPNYRSAPKLEVLSGRKSPQPLFQWSLIGPGGGYSALGLLARAVRERRSQGACLPGPPNIRQRCDIRALEQQYRIELAPKTGAPRVITAHLDFIQVRNGAVHILDYKPDARTNKPIAQLTIYALALSRLTGIKLFGLLGGICGRRGSLVLREVADEVNRALLPGR